MSETVYEEIMRGYEKLKAADKKNRCLGKPQPYFAESHQVAIMAKELMPCLRVLYMKNNEWVEV